MPQPRRVAVVEKAQPWLTGALDLRYTLAERLTFMSYALDHTEEALVDVIAGDRDVTYAIRERLKRCQARLQK